MCAHGKLGTPFDSTVGVKQGDPLSPLLVGVFLDRLEAQRCPGVGARLAGNLIRALLYADDIALVSDSAEGLRDMLAALHEFSQANSMFVNLKKSEVVVFKPGGARGDGKPKNGGAKDSSTRGHTGRTQKKERRGKRPNGRAWALGGGGGRV